MSDRKFWDELNALGPEAVRHGLATYKWYGPGTRESEARVWLEHYESTAALADRSAIRASADEANSVARSANIVAEEANSLARSANTLAERANESAEEAASFAKRTAIATDELARTAKTNAVIATLALIVSAIAIAVSIVSIFVKP